MHFWKITVPLHLGAVALGAAALSQGSVLPLIAWTLVWWIMLSAGVEVGFHRLFSHGAFETSKRTRWILAILGSMAAQGTLLFWASVHRSLHHPHTDTKLDPHSPIHGRWHAYVGWLLDSNLKLTYRSNPDLLRDPVVKFCYKRYELLILAALLVSGLIGGWAGAAGYLLATVSCFHQTAVVNVVCHDSNFGYSSYSTSDRSRNVRLLSVWTWGLSLHNNHHASPRLPEFAHKSGEVDPAAWVIRLLKI